MKNVIFSALMAVGLMMVPAAAKAEVTIGVVDVKHYFFVDLAGCTCGY